MAKKPPLSMETIKMLEYIQRLEKNLDHYRPHRSTWERRAMLIAIMMSSFTHCKYTKAGLCILDDDHRIIATGYNGPVRGDARHCDEVGCAKKDGFDGKIGRCRGAHSEINALSSCPNPRLLQGTILVITTEPCFDCAKAIVQMGVKKVIYKDAYVRLADQDRHTTEHEDVADLFARAGVAFEQF